ncbi:LruC domain-containing protein, partial [Parabacteroides sp.]
ATFNGFNINLGESSYMYIKGSTGRGLDLRMEESAMFDADNMDQKGDLKVSGPASGNALLNIKSLRIGGTTRLSNIVAAYWDNMANYSGWNAITLNGVSTSKGQSDIYIPEGDCNEVGNGKDPDDVVPPDTDEDYEEEATLSYTYMFEDNWPAQGDYDMNDLVMNVQIMNKKSGNKVTGFKTKCILYATGGTKELDVAFQLVDVPANKLSGAESGQTYAVAELFRDAHTQLGSAKRVPINTYSITAEPAVFEKSYTFSGSLEQPVTAGNLNLFIVWGGMDSNPRNEVHLPGFGGTDKATAGSYLSEDKWMWAIAVPTDDFASYPKETVRIDDAYEGFGSWILGGDVPGWYKVTEENAGKVISWK